MKTAESRSGGSWLLLCVLVGGAAWIMHAWLFSGPDWVGMSAPDAPNQENLDTPIDLPPVEGWAMRGLARFDSTALVLSRRNYRKDALSDVCPTDLLLGWGIASDAAIVAALKVDQYGRFGHWASDDPSMQGRWMEFGRSAANTHIIPANKGVRLVLEGVERWDVVRIRGWLVEARPPSGQSPARSSLVRDDTGAGACEIILVENLTVHPPRKAR